MKLDPTETESATPLVCGKREREGEVGKETEDEMKKCHFSFLLFVLFGQRRDFKSERTENAQIQTKKMIQCDSFVFRTERKKNSSGNEGNFRVTFDGCMNVFVRVSVDLFKIRLSAFPRILHTNTQNVFGISNIHRVMCLHSHSFRFFFSVLFFFYNNYIISIMWIQ